ncbi:4Fe-4S binding protein [Metallumcola ferriviriculae]|uniref:4Fe-4S binding protein n=1 Tax=Metallumcola ferriviriculae TaxID=3039180 RepID=A0AAU0UME4_9FIRM|nr:4Fe-4S binding protein [Desulfitibacteraceae bacterium MK1]
MAKKGVIILFKDNCKGCGICTVFCPQNLLTLSDELNVLGYHPVQVTDMEKCTGCAFCARMCPDVVIQVERVSR